jgi:rhodanese-related sulfurtransferase
MVVLMVASMTAAGAAAEHTKDSLEKVKKDVAAKKAVIVDVREQKEWDAGHLSDARLLPLSKLAQAEGSKGFAERVAKELPKDKVIYCHCKAGGRALTAADILKELGYDVRPLKPGYQDLIQAGFPKAK